MKLLRAYFDLGKLRLSLLVVATTLAGYLLAHGSVAWTSRSASYGGPGGPPYSFLLAATLLGTLLSALGANALNQWCERGRDAQMRRTQKRPLPSGRVTETQALALGLASCVAGVALLALSVNLLTAAISLSTVLLYVLVYTPLKTRSTLNTLVGALVGALPPVMGWTAATGHIGYGAAALACVLFVWQIPHFLGLAWLYREDYARGGFAMLPVLQPDGRATGQMMLLYSFALIPAGLLLAIGHVSGALYGAGSLLLGGAMVALAWRFYFTRSAKSARAVFAASLLYLPLLLALLILNARPAPVAYILSSPIDKPAASQAGTSQASAPLGGLFSEQARAGE